VRSDDDLIEQIKRPGQQQARLTALQSKLPGMSQSGTAGGGKVAVKINGRGELLSVSIDPSLLDPACKTELETTILGAMRLARSRIDAMIELETQRLAGGTG
jgi:DNA-binding YbaB/EbfC family protein